MKNLYHIESKPVEEAKYVSIFQGYKLDNKAEKVTMKSITKSCLTKDEILNLKQVVKSLCKVRHPNVEKYLNLFEDNKRINIVTEKIEDETLCHRLMNAEEEMQEQEIKRIIQQVADTLKFLHKADIMHKNIRPENICIDADGQIKLIDFEDSKNSVEQVNIRKKCKLSFFTAPEFFSDKLDTKCDIWSLGVLAYYLCTEQFPFSEEVYLAKCGRQEGYKSTHKDKNINRLSADFRDLIDKMLQFKPEDRLSINQVLSHQWFDSQWDESTICDSSMMISEIEDTCNKKTLKRLKNFSKKPELQSILLHLLVDSNKPGLNEKAASEFRKIDQNGDGFIDHIELVNAFRSCNSTLTEMKSISILCNISLGGKPTISYSEFLVAIKHHKYLKESHLTKLFTKLDTLGLFLIDENNIISEVKKLNKDVSVNSFKESLKSFDVFNKGFIDYEEFKNICICNI